MCGGVRYDIMWCGLRYCSVFRIQFRSRLHGIISVAHIIPYGGWYDIILYICNQKFVGWTAVQVAENSVTELSGWQTGRWRGDGWLWLKSDTWLKSDLQKKKG